MCLCVLLCMFVPTVVGMCVVGVCLVVVSVGMGVGHISREGLAAAQGSHGGNADVGTAECFLWRLGKPQV